MVQPIDTSKHKAAAREALTLARSIDHLVRAIIFAQEEGAVVFHGFQVPVEVVAVNLRVLGRVLVTQLDHFFTIRHDDNFTWGSGTATNSREKSYRSTSRSGTTMISPDKRYRSRI